MLKFSAHLEMNFAKADSFEDRWKKAAEYGFAGCEFVWRAHDQQEVLQLKEAYPMQIACLGGMSGFNPGPARPLLILPEDRDRLIADTHQAIEYAKTVGGRNLIFVPGNLQADWPLKKHRKEAAASFRAVAPMLEKAGVTGILEPLNSKVDHKGTYCENTTEAFQLIDEVASPNVKILYDIYHMQIMEGNLIDTISEHHDKIGYYHVASVPGRNEPIGGEVNLTAVIEAVERTGYDGFVGLEYAASGSPDQAFQALREAYPEAFLQDGGA